VSQERNLTARSVVASLLLGTRGARLSGNALVRVAGLFGFADGTTRVALSRMVAGGELVADGGSYRLAGPLLDRYDRQEEGRHPRLRRWQGDWRLAIVGSAGPRAAGERAAVRRRLGALRLAEWREGVWLRPDNLEATPPAMEGCSWALEARLEPPVDPAQLWDLTAWTAAADELLARIPATPATDGLAPSFLLAAAVVRHLRDDPLLPPELLPAGWPGDRLRRAYDRYESDFQATLRSITDTLA
jgi:phenylacetic acid degradation operon negative regulatory protein